MLHNFTITRLTKSAKFYSKALYPSSRCGLGTTVVNTTTAPKTKTASPVQFTSIASPDHSPRGGDPFWRKVNFSSNPSSAVTRAVTYAVSPKKMCHGSIPVRCECDTLCDQKATNPRIHCIQKSMHILSEKRLTSRGDSLLRTFSTVSSMVWSGWFGPKVSVLCLIKTCYCQ